jgi:hypothetical protein
MLAAVKHAPFKHKCQSNLPQAVPEGGGAGGGHSEIDNLKTIHVLIGPSCVSIAHCSLPRSKRQTALQYEIGSSRDIRGFTQYLIGLDAMRSHGLLVLEAV